MLTESEVNPDQQIPMPFKAADDYAQQVMGWAKAFDDKGMTVEEGVAYGPHRLHRYNVFSPFNAKDAPVLIFWHGGGWTNGYRDYTTFMAPYVTRLGMVLVAPSYRLAPAHPLPAAFEDGLALLQAFGLALPALGVPRTGSTCPAIRPVAIWLRCWPCAPPTGTRRDCRRTPFAAACPSAASWTCTIPRRRPQAWKSVSTTWCWAKGSKTPS